MSPGWAHWLVREVLFPDSRLLFHRCVFVTGCSSAQQHFTALYLHGYSIMQISWGHISSFWSTEPSSSLLQTLEYYSIWLQTAPGLSSDLHAVCSQNTFSEIQRSLFSDIKNQENSGAGQTFAEVCTFQRKSLTSWLHAHSRLPWSCLQTCVYNVSIPLTMSALRASATRSGAAAGPCSLSRAWGVLQLSAAFSISSRLGLDCCGWSLMLSSVFTLVEVPPTFPLGSPLPSVWGWGNWSGSGRSSQKASVRSSLSAMTAAKWTGDATAERL